jgi:hypothetical protein
MNKPLSSELRTGICGCWRIHFAECESAENLHCSRGDVIASDAGQLACGARFDDGHVDATSREIDGQRHPNGTSADHQYFDGSAG